MVPSDNALAFAFKDIRGLVNWDTPQAPPGARWSPDGQYWASLYGAIYNTEELKAALSPNGWINKHSDAAQLVVAGFLAWGREVLNRLVGDFALALWDGNQQRFLGATDPLGARPFYFADQGGCLRYSSHTAPLHQELGVPDEIDDEAVVAFLIGAEHRPDKTLYRHIQRLPGGHFLEAGPGQWAVRRYWGPGFAPAAEIRTKEELIERFREVMLQAVQERLRLASRTGIMMSGGFDSTSVAGAASRLHPANAEGIRIFSNVFQGLPCDESQRIHTALRALQLTADIRSPHAAALTPEMMRLDVTRHDGPRVNLQHALFEGTQGAAKAWGTSVMLTGVGGDEVTIDYDYHVDLLAAAGARGIIPALQRWARTEKVPLRAVLPLWARQACPAWFKGMVHQVRPGHRRDVFPATGRCLQPRWRPLAHRFCQTHGTTGPVFDSHTTQLRWTRINAPQVQGGLSWWGRNMAADGIFCCSPFQDRRLLELVFATPTHLQPRTFDAGEYKPLITRALGPYLPRELTGAYWKVEFSSFNDLVLDKTIARNRAFIFEKHPWRSARYLDQEAVIQEIGQWQQDTRRRRVGPWSAAPGVSFIERIIGLEVWLGTVERPVPKCTLGRTS